MFKALSGQREIKASDGSSLSDSTRILFEGPKSYSKRRRRRKRYLPRFTSVDLRTENCLSVNPRIHNCKCNSMKPWTRWNKKVLLAENEERSPDRRKAPEARQRQAFEWEVEAMHIEEAKEKRPRAVVKCEEKIMRAGENIMWFINTENGPLSSRTALLGKNVAKALSSLSLLSDSPTGFLPLIFVD